MRNHITLEICLFVMNFNSGGVSLRILYCVVDTDYGFGGSLGDCRPVLLKGRKYQMVKTQTESHDRRPIVEQTNGRSGFPFPLGLSGAGWNLSHGSLGVL